MNREEYISYRKLPEILEIQSGDKIWISSALPALIMSCKKGQELFSVQNLLEIFLQKVGPKGTVILPTFCFDFSNKGIYDYHNSKGQTGILGNYALTRSDFKRTRHPLHSFAVYGSDQICLCSMENRNSFGADSPFEYCRVQNVKQVMIGTDYNHAMTMVHYAEMNANVPYRFMKIFQGTYVNEDGYPIAYECEYPARKLEYVTEEKFNRIGARLEQSQIAKKYICNGITHRVVELGRAYPVILKDAKENMCRELYDFEIPREQIWGENHP